MTMNRKLVGREYPPTEFSVTAEAIAAYARATNEENPRYLDPDAAGGMVAPPIFSVVYQPRALGQAIGDPELGIAFKRALHGEQDMRFHAAIRPGDTISTRARIAAIEAKATGETISIELVSQNQHAAPVETTLFTLFVRAEAGVAKGSGSGAASEPAAARAEPVARVSQQIDHDQTFRYAEASGDRTRIHTDDEAARKAGLPAIIGHGLCTMAFVSRALVDTLCGGDAQRLARMALRFARPVFPGQLIETRIRPAEKQDGSWHFAFETLNPDGQAVVSDGIAEIRPES